MKVYLLCLFVFLAVKPAAFCQGIRFEKDSLPVIIEKAKQADKSIMIFLDAVPAMKGSPEQKERELFNSPVVASKMQDAFICYKAAFGTPESRKLAAKYKVSVFPTFIFLNSYGELVHRTYGFYALPEKYTQMADYVTTVISNGHNVAAYNNRYKAGERSRSFLSLYISARERLGEYNNADLIDDYVYQLSLKEINTYPQMLFILHAGPLVGSRAIQLTYMFKPMRDSVYKMQPKATNIAINNRTINNTMALAIAKKDRNLAYQAANFAQSTHSSDFKKGVRANQSNMVYFYRTINDTSSFFQQATYFYDNYYMSVSVDSAHRYQQKYLDSIKNQRAVQALKYKDSTSARLYYSQTSTNNTFATVLNSVAWDFYKTGTQNQVHLLKAITWVKHSIAIEPNYHNYDTYAHLLYQVGFYAEAEAQQNMAIKIAEDNKVPKEVLTEFKDALSKIKKRQL